MNIFGIGPTELVLVLLIMLMVAGPKRMARWAYVMGVYMGKLREMWKETSDVLKKELAEAGFEPEVVDTLGKVANPRTRRAVVSSELDKLVGEMKKPVEESLKPVQQALEPVKTTLQDVGTTPLTPAAPANEATATPTSATSDEPDSPETATGQYDAWTAS